ncbi:MAG: hypothetical protein HOF10_09505, partial [Chloroflexi bacterium]|nr:hypothetical protein [Chloroflexota bacterium]
VLETRYDEPSYEPACHLCTAQSQRLTAGASVEWFDYQENNSLKKKIIGLTVEELSEVVFQDIPLGKLVLPSFRWALRRQYLPEDDATQFLLTQFILSAYNVANKFKKLLDENPPAVVVVFNGQMFPEAVARFIAQKQDIPVVTHEVSFQPLSGFFTYGEATAFPIEIPEDFELNEIQNLELDEYLGKRFQGSFTMAGIQFWPEMKSLSQELVNKIEKFEQVVPIFTNVVFDTSQPHANMVFENMFTWLDSILEKIKVHPETLFVIRAHPDEHREGKASVDSVQKWLLKNQVDQLPNVVFIDSNDFISSYDLIARAKFVIVYNSSIALEATLMGAAVLCGGKSRFTAYDTMFFPATVPEYQEKIEEFLNTENVDVPDKFIMNARRFLYFQNWQVSLPFDDFIEEHALNGYVKFKNFNPETLHPNQSKTIQKIVDGLFEDKSFTKKVAK